MNSIDMLEKDGQVIVAGIKDFNLKHIFECGQCFRWNKEKNDSYTGVAMGSVINIKQENGKLIVENTTIEDFKNIWFDYFDLNRDYSAVKALLAKNDPIMARAVKFGNGIRILNQDEWEILISFIISQNRNIPIIKQNIEKLCKKYGSYIENYKGKNYYDFPSPETLSRTTTEEIEACKVGYRAKYIQKVAQCIADDKSIYGFQDCSLKEAETYLLNLFGVGPKVAHCIMLFSMQGYDSFPIDVWVQRVMKELYGLEDRKKIKEFAQKKFNQYGGFAQQYLFYYARENGIGK